jgi:hypothetical protein
MQPHIKRPDIHGFSPVEASDFIDFCGRLKLDSGDPKFDFHANQFYSDLKCALWFYFYAKPSKFPSHWKRTYQEEMELYRMRYILLHKLLSVTWKDLKEVSQEEQFPLPDTPCETIKSILLADAELEIAKHQDGLFAGLISHYKLGLRVKKKEKLCKAKLSDLTTKVWDKLPIDYVEIKRLEFFCLRCIEKLKLDHGDHEEEVRKSLESFREAESDIWKYQMKISHPR